MFGLVMLDNPRIAPHPSHFHHPGLSLVDSTAKIRARSAKMIRAGMSSSPSK
jgi:hypothetical protein